MKLTKILLIFLFSFIATSISAQASDIYGPFLQANPNRIEATGGYCTTQDDERKLWSGINKFAKSVLQVFPAVPPQWAAYLNTERNSGNFNRKINVEKTSFYKINTVLVNTSNLVTLSEAYLNNHSKLTLQKKMEFIGRTLVNVYSVPIDIFDFESVSTDLKSKGYYISVSELTMNWAITSGIKEALIFHLICYGDRQSN